MITQEMVESKTESTMGQQWRGNSYSAQRDLFIYTSARNRRLHIRPQTRELPTGRRY